MKRKKSLFWLLLVAALLLTALLALRKFGPKEEPETAPTITTLYSVDSNAITELSWKMEGKSLTFVRGENGWTYPEDPLFAVDGSSLDSLAHSASGITSSRTIPAVEDLAAYGLADPVISLTITANGESRTFDFGDPAAVNAGKQYCTDGSGNVYLVGSSVTSGFSADYKSFAYTEQSE